MLRTPLKCPAGRTYCAAGLLLLVAATLECAHHPLWVAMPQATAAICFALLSYAFAVLLDETTLPLAVKTLFASFYGLGTVLMFSTFTWLDLVAAWLRDSDWLGRLGMISLVLPAMILLPVVAALFGVLRYPRERQERAYLFGGLCLVVLCVGKFWSGLFNNFFLAASLLPNSIMEVLWLPAGMVVATAGVLLGCFRHELHRCSLIGSAAVICFLTGAALVPLHLFADPSPQGDRANAFGLLATILLGVCVPASVMTRPSVRFTIGDAHSVKADRHAS